MGLFKDLLGVGESVASPVYKKAVRPAYEAAARPVVKPVGKGILSVLNEYGNRTRPFAYALWKAPVVAEAYYKEPYVPFTTIGRARFTERLRQRGILDTELGDAVAGNKDAQRQVNEQMATLPWYSQMALEIAGDPMTAAGVGFAARAGAAASAKGMPGVLRAVGLELLNQSGVPSVAKLPYELTYGARKGGQIASASRLRTVVDLQTDALRDISAAKYEGLSAAHRAAALDDYATLRAGIEAQITGATTAEGIAARVGLAFKMPDLKTLEQQYGALAERVGLLTGDSLRASDYVGQARRKNFTHFIAQITDADREFNNRFVHQVAPAGRLEAGVQKVPGVRTVFNAIAPDTLARLGDDPVHAIAIQRAGTLEEIQQHAGLLRGQFSLAQRNADLAGDPVTGLIAKLKPVDGFQPTVENILRYPGKFRSQLSNKQMDVLDGWTTAKKAILDTARAVYQEADPATRTRIEERLGALLKGAEVPGGGEYVPRVGLFYSTDANGMQAFVAGQSEASVLRRIAARVHLPTPFGDLRVPVKRLGKTALPADFEKMSTSASTFGAKQTMEFDRVLDNSQDAKRVLFSNDMGDMVHEYTRQVYQILADESVTRPALTKLGKKASQIISGQFDIDKTLALRFADKGGKANLILKSIARGDKVSASTVAQLRRYADSGDLPEEVRVILNTVAESVDHHLLAQQGVEGGTKIVSSKLAQTGARLEERVSDLAVQPFEPRAPGGLGARESITELQAAPDIARGQEAQELAAQLTGAGLKAADVPLLGTPAIRRRAIKDILQGGIDSPPPSALQGAELEAYQTARKQITAQITTSGLTPDMWYMQSVDNPRLGLPGPPDPPNLMNSAENARINMVNAARDNVDLIEAHLKGARAEVKDIATAKAQALKENTVFDLRQSKVPGLSGTWFDNAIADDINKAFLPGGGDNLLQQGAAFQAIVQTMQAGQDFSVSFLQGFAALAANPLGWTKGIALAMASVVHPEVYAKYLEGLSRAYDLKTGKSVIDMAGRARLSLSGTELYAPSELLAATGVSNEKLGAIAQFIGNMPLNRAFAIQRNVASMELFRTQVALEQAIMGKGATDAELQSIGRQVNLATGVVSSQKLGIGKNQALIERTTGRFGVQWFRSQTGRLVQAMQMGTIDGRVARRVLFQQLAAMTALYGAAAAGMGQAPNLDPSDRDFLTLKVNGQRVSFGGLYPSIMKTVTRTAEAVAAGDTEALTDIRNGKNPLLNFWRNGAPLIGAMIADGVGVNANTPWATSPLGELAPTNLLPFNVQAAQEAQGSLLDRAIAGGLTASGLNVSPQTVTDIWNETSNQYAKERGAQKWADLPKAVQEEALRTVPELQEADAARQEWFDKHGSLTPLDTAVDQNDRSRAAANDTLAGLWARVQAGTMDKSTFRQAYNDWSANHSYFTENLFGSLPEEDRKVLEGKDGKGIKQDVLAAKYQAIQPIDTTGTGTPSDADFRRWETARREFWSANPDAAQFRDYILFEYPTRVWDSPITRGAVTELKQAQDLNAAFMELPKYKGLSRDEGDFLDQLLAAKSQASKELGALAAQAGVPPDRIRIPADMAWKYTFASLQEQGLRLTQRQGEIFKLAAVVDARDEVKLQLIDPRRFQFLRENPLLLEWYPSSGQSTGIPQRVLERLGLVAGPTGASVSERLGTLLQ